MSGRGDASELERHNSAADVSVGGLDDDTENLFGRLFAFALPISGGGREMRIQNVLEGPLHERRRNGVESDRHMHERTPACMHRS